MNHSNELLFGIKEPGAGWLRTSKSQKRVTLMFLSFVIICLFSQNLAFTQNEQNDLQNCIYSQSTND